MRFLALPLFFGSLALASAQYPGAQPPPDDLKKGFDSITEREAKDYLTFLATKCEGRGTGQPGFQKAADYVAAHFKRDGLKPMGDDGTYFQSTTFYRSRLKPGSLAATVDGKPIASDRDISIQSNGKVDVTGPIVLVRAKGQNAVIPDGTDLAGKIVVLDTTGVGRRFRGLLFTANPAAVFTLSPSTASGSWNVSQTKPNPGMATRVNGSISSKSLGRILDSLTPNGSTALTTAVADDTVKITSFNPPVHVTADVEVEPVKVSNVVGLIEGTDPTLKAEYIGIGGHLDHLGKRGDVVYPGADDDGSGSTAVLCIAKAMTTNPKKPRRSILLMTFFGEEMGLLGSHYLSEHPPVPLEHMVSELQMDMVGRDSYGIQNGDAKRNDKLEENMDTMRLVGSKRISTELDTIIQDVNKYVGFKFKYDAEDVYTRSDHYNFARKGVPIAFLFDGFTPDYHQPSDTVDKIDWLKLTNAAKLYYLTAETIADRDQPPVKDVKQ